MSCRQGRACPGILDPWISDQSGKSCSRPRGRGLRERFRASLIPYGNEPEGLGVSQPVGDVGIGLSGTQMLS